MRLDRGPDARLILSANRRSPIDQGSPPVAVGRRPLTDWSRMRALILPHPSACRKIPAPFPEFRRRPAVPGLLALRA